MGHPVYFFGKSHVIPQIKDNQKENIYLQELYQYIYFKAIYNYKQTQKKASYQEIIYFSKRSFIVKKGIFMKKSFLILKLGNKHVRNI